MTATLVRLPFSTVQPGHTYCYILMSDDVTALDLSDAMGSI